MADRSETENRALPSRAPRIVWRVFLGALSAILVVSLFVYGVFGIPLPGLNDQPPSHLPAAYRVARTQSTQVIPDRMTLADPQAYGDSQFQASSGDISASWQAAAFGSVYQSSVADMISSDPSAVSSDPTGPGTLSKPLIGAAQADDSISLLSDSMGESPLVLSTRMTSDRKGTGAVASTVSWASKGDLKGMAVASAVDARLAQSFLLPSTQTGWTQQLVLVNPSSKATVATMKAHGSHDGNALALSADSSVTVDAHSRTIVNVSATAPDQEGVYLTVSSSVTPLSAFVRVVHMDGLDPQGNDFALPVDSAPANSTLSLPALASASAATVRVYSDRSAHMTLQWLTKEGKKEGKKITVTGGQVQVLSFQDFPRGARGLAVTADQDFSVSAELKTSSGEQADFALENGQKAGRTSALALPKDVSATLYAANSSDSETAMVLQAFDDQGKLISAKTYHLPAHSVTALSSASASSSSSSSSKESSARAFCLVQGEGTASISKKPAAVTLSASLAAPSLNKAGVKALATVNGSSLEVVSERVSIRQQPVLR